MGIVNEDADPAANLESLLEDVVSLDTLDAIADMGDYNAIVESVCREHLLELIYWHIDCSRGGAVDVVVSEEERSNG